ncbi:hypothetical protein ACFL03_13520 [Thermodesulfobacteriota bacterium]
MSSYQKEQIESFSMVRKHTATLTTLERKAFESEISDYLSFRDEVDAFLVEHFSAVCTQKCYQDMVSACCSREGIITFFGDIVVNVLVSQDSEIKALMNVLQQPNSGFKCIYLGNNGCVWRVKPIVCEMFLCKQARSNVFEKNSPAGQVWEELKQRQKLYTWPDRPVLFDNLERYFMDAGYTSSLMYLHNSPGLLRVKAQAKVSR